MGGGGQPHFCQFLPMLMLPKMEKAGCLEAKFQKLTKIGKNWQKLKNIGNDINNNNA